MSVRPVARLFLAMVFLATQLSMSWAAAMPLADEDTCGHATHEMMDSHYCVAGEAGNQHDSHIDADCNSDCQMCAIVLPLFERALACNGASQKVLFNQYSLPPGSFSHPYRPPAST